MAQELLFLGSKCKSMSLSSSKGSWLPVVETCFSCRFLLLTLLMQCLFETNTLASSIDASSQFYAQQFQTHTSRCMHLPPLVYTVYIRSPIGSGYNVVTDWHFKFRMQGRSSSHVSHPNYFTLLWVLSNTPVECEGESKDRCTDRLIIRRLRIRDSFLYSSGPSSFLHFMEWVNFEVLPSDTTDPFICCNPGHPVTYTWMTWRLFLKTA